MDVCYVYMAMFWKFVRRFQLIIHIAQWVDGLAPTHGQGTISIRSMSIWIVRSYFSDRLNLDLEVGVGHGFHPYWWWDIDPEIDRIPARESTGVWPGGWWLFGLVYMAIPFWLSLADLMVALTVPTFSSAQNIQGWVSRSMAEVVWFYNTCLLLSSLK